MPRNVNLQASFAGGEISPRLYGRTDIVKYQTGAEAIENFIVRPEGGLQRRHGTRYAGAVKTQSAVTRLVPFIFSTVQAYILEFGNLYCRVWKQYGNVLNVGVPVEFVTTYTTADIPNLQFAQSADTLFVSHINYPPRIITRTSDIAWSITDVDRKNGPFTGANSDDTIRLLMEITGTNYDPGDTGTMRSTKNLFTANDVGEYWYVEEQYYADKSVAPWSVNTEIGTTLGTQVSNDGNVYEMADIGNGTQTGRIGPTHTIGEAWDDSTNGSAQHKKWRYLHSRYVIVKITSYTDAQTVGITLQTRIPNGMDPDTQNISGAANNGAGLIRITTNSAHGYGLGDWVRISGVTGTTEANGNWRITNIASTTFDLEGSAFVNAYVAGGDTVKRFASYKWRRAAFGVTRGYPSAVTLHEQRLIWGGNTAEPFGTWMSKVGDFYNFLPSVEDDGPINYNIASSQVNVIRWLESSDNLLIGTVAQEFAAYGGGQGDPLSPANTRIVPQSNEGGVSAQPVRAANEVVFINRSGRKVCALDFDVSSGHYGAADLTELAMHLTSTGKTFTRIAWARNPSSTLWALLSDGTLCSLTYRKDQQVWAWARHPLGDGIVESIAVIPSADGTVDDLWMIVRRTVNGSTARYVEYLANTFEPASNTDTSLMAFMDSALRYSGVAVSALSGISHLEGKTVKVVSNGALHPDCVVSGGAITLNAPTTNAWVGLAYTSRLRTLKPEIAAASGTVQGKTKRVSRVTVRVLNSLGGKVSDEDEVVFENLLHRDMADLMDAAPKLKSGDYDVDLSSDYGTGARIVVLQTEPLPLDILCVMPGITVSEG